MIPDSSHANHPSATKPSHLNSHVPCLNFWSQFHEHNKITVVLYYYVLGWFVTQQQITRNK